VTLDSDPCPCGSGAAYAACCGRWHAGTPAPTAEALMRSRYSAYVLQNAEYLLASWHPSTWPASLHFEPGLKWLGLDVRRHQTDGDRATVEFVARSKLGGRAHRLHEASRFVREAGRWYYVDGDVN
jgi:SEC-C motif-containing protein